MEKLLTQAQRDEIKSYEQSLKKIEAWRKVAAHRKPLHYEALKALLKIENLTEEDKTRIMLRLKGEKLNNENS